MNKNMEEYNKGVLDGTLAERERIIKYLMDKNVLREAYFYEGLVAMDIDGNTGIDLDKKLGGE